VQKIVPHLWFDKEAKQAAEFYVAAFGAGSRITSMATLHDTPSGDADIVSFELNGFTFMAISAGPVFKINPAVSFILNFDPGRDSRARENLDALWARLSAGGTPLMPLDAYPFSPHYGWIQDKFGVSWQLMLTNPQGDERPFITPSMMFVGDVSGKAEEATDFYLSVFRDSRRGVVARYPAGMAPDREGTLMFTDFQLEKQWFAAMDSAHPHQFRFNEAVSFLVRCETQEDIDYYWGKLSAVPQAEQCGWLKDRYGFSWQIAPADMEEMLRTGSRKQVDNLTRAFLPMKKLDLAKLRAVFAGN
jgi:predicted 3-demethylubiquinone-9 3-methyltransferase (glyoxalase superfamily)